MAKKPVITEAAPSIPERKPGVSKEHIALMAGINKKYGEGTISSGNCAAIQNIETIPTHIACLEAAIGIPGIPRGRIIEVMGLESCGKTTTVLHMAAGCQKTWFPKKKRYGVVMFIDAEHAVDPSWAKDIGVDWDSILFSQPNSGNEVFNIIDVTCKSGLVDLIIVDSVAGLIPKEELEGKDLGDGKIGAQARLMSAGLRATHAILNKSDTSVVFINQIRQKIGVKFGNPETTPGGLALKFYASVRIDMRKCGTVYEDGSHDFEGSGGKQKIGIRTRAKIIKSKVARPFKTCEFNIIHNEPPLPGEPPLAGIDLVGSLFDVAVDRELIVVRGSNYYDAMQGGNAKLGAGAAKAIKFLRENPEYVTRLRAELVKMSAQDSTHMSEKDNDEMLDDALEGEENIPETDEHGEIIEIPIASEDALVGDESPL